MALPEAKTWLPRQMTKSEATRRRIIDAAAKVLVREGYAGTRLTLIAEQADLQAGSLYYYFDSKEELVEETLGKRLRCCRTTATSGERLSCAVHAFVEAILDIGSMSPAHIRSYHQLPADMQERLRPGVKDFASLWESLLDDAVRAGQVRHDVDPYLLLLFVIHSAEQVTQWPEHILRSPRQVVDTMQTLIMSAVLR
jgi:AcrR family transcriptional regulator